MYFFLSGFFSGASRFGCSHYRHSELHLEFVQISKGKSYKRDINFFFNDSLTWTSNRLKMTAWKNSSKSATLQGTNPLLLRRWFFAGPNETSLYNNGSTPAQLMDGRNERLQWLNMRQQ